MSKTKCELCRIANMVDDARRHPGLPSARAIRTRLERVKAYEAGVKDLCSTHEGRGRVDAGQTMEHWAGRVEMLAHKHAKRSTKQNGQRRGYQR